jgi:hypothetical protein
MSNLAVEDPLAVRVVDALQTGNVAALRQMLTETPSLATARLGSDERGWSRTLLHIATDWPGHFPNTAAMIIALIEAGADVNAQFIGPHAETPLHWAASNNDIEALDVLIDLGADIEAPGGVIGNGPPLADATAFGQWDAARRLVERGAKTTLWDAASLGLLDRVESLLATAPRPAQAELNAAFWGACHGGQRRTAEYLLTKGADINWIPRWERKTPLDAARRSLANELVDWMLPLGAKSANDIP